MIRAIVLDYAGVMTVPISMPSKPNEGAVAADPDDLRSVMKSLMAHEIHNPDPMGMWNQLERGEISFDSYCDHLHAVHPLAGQAFRSGVANMMASVPLRPTMAERVLDWKARGLKVALLTNNVAEWRSMWREKLGEASLLDAFDEIIDSSEVGMRKPEARVYLHVVELLGVAPDEAVFVDDLAQNVEGAAAVGLHALLATPDDEHLTAIDALLQGIDSTAFEQ